MILRLVTRQGVGGGHGEARVATGLPAAPTGRVAQLSAMLGNGARKLGGGRGGAWLLATLIITAAFGRLAVRNLANFRPVSNDEVELIAVAYKLATRGVLGSDMYAGFFGGDDHHLETLPLQHVLEAISFRLFGAGILQARGVSLLAAVSIVWLVGWLAYRWYGLGAAIVCELLLVAWPSNLTAVQNGLPLLGVARAARYDVLAVASVWLAVALLDLTLRRPRPLRALALGVSVGVATLSQFFGSFVVPLLALGWIWARRGASGRPGAAGGSLRAGGRGIGGARIAAWAAVGAAVVLAPYAVYVARYPADLLGQLTAYGTNRGDFLRPGFYAENLTSEWTRYVHLFSQGSDNALDASRVWSTWLLVLGIWPAIAFVAWRSRRAEAAGDRLLLVSLGTFALLLALLDQTKVPLYAILLLPSICLALAAFWTGVLAWALRGRLLRLAIGAAAAAALVAVGLEGLAAYQADFAEATQVTPYLALGQQIESAVAPDASVLGPERWWWPLHDHQYLSLRSIWFQWAAAASKGGDSPRFVDWVTRSQADSVIVNVNVRADIHAFPESLQMQFWSYVERCTTQVGDIQDANYFDVEVYAVRRPAPDGCA